VVVATGTAWATAIEADVFACRDTEESQALAAAGAFGVFEVFGAFGASAVKAAAGSYDSNCRSWLYSNFITTPALRATPPWRGISGVIL